jgi:colicin import membrane protein
MATQAERMALARAKALETLALPETAVQIGVGEFAFQTEAGYVKVKVTAVKDKEFDPVEAGEEFQFEQEEKRVKAEKRKAEAEAKKAANIAKKAKAKAEKEAKEKAEA